MLLTAWLVLDFKQILNLARKKDYSIHRYFDDPNTSPAYPPPDSPHLANAVAGYVATNPQQDRSHRLHIPSVADLICHLKLLKAVEVYKTMLFAESEALEDVQLKQWQVFVSNAVRRFVIYVSALREYARKEIFLWYRGADEELIYKNGVRKDRNFMARMVAILPPLDIIMVWHAFLLLPRTMYDHFMRSQFMQFAMFPMPLKLISDAIDNKTFAYNPAPHFLQAYHTVMVGFTDNPHDLVYHLDDLWLTHHVLDVYCPICGEILVENVPWSQDDRTGFADANFRQEIKISYCRCDFGTRVITHEELRKRQLVADLHRGTPLAGLFKYYLKIISHRSYHDRDAIRINQTVLLILKQCAGDLKRQTLAQFIRARESSSEGKKINLLLRNYVLMNPIHCTVPGGFEIWEDLVGCVLRQHRFTTAMNHIDWLHLPFIREGMKELIVRYARFFSLLTKYEQQQVLVPTLDIDLVWHTHQLLMVYYFEDCMHTPAQFVIDHDDKVEQGRLDGGFEATARLYRSKFKETYLICFCRFCLAIRLHSRNLILSKVSLLLGGRDDEKKWRHHPLYLPQVGLTHISLHNAIELPLVTSKRERQLDQVTVPWEDSSIYYYGKNPTHFVNPPLAPLQGENYHLFGAGLCCTSRDFGATCQGVVSLEDYS